MDAKRITTPKIKLLALFILIGSLSIGFPAGAGFSAQSRSSDYVVLMHGLGRTAKSFQKMAHRLEQNGYDVLNLDYPSRKYDIPVLTARIIQPAVTNYCRDKNRKVHFVTHSMGDIIARYLLKTYPLKNLGRVVMIAPPNSGSEVVDFLKDRALINKIMGPAFNQLGTDPQGFVNALGDMNAEVGVVSGNQSMNPINSLIIPGEDDGKVSVDRARLNTMMDFMVVRRTHTFIMNADEVITAVLQFIRTGRFHAAK